MKAILFGSAALLLGAGCGLDPDATSLRHPIEAQELEGSCQHDDGTHCGDVSEGNCWCDTLCTQYEDCCADFHQVCGCTPSNCDALGAQCGEIDDGCGGTLDCGGCEEPLGCGGGGEPNRCGCAPSTCAELGVDCGEVDDGCGGTLDCGGCGGPQLCGPHEWQRAVPATGGAMMAYAGKVYLFAEDGLIWTIVEEESAVTQAIPLPEGFPSMRSVTAEIAPSGRPLVTFQSSNERYATFFDGARFGPVTHVGRTTIAHADAAERIYAVNANGLTEFPEPDTAIVRGAFPQQAKAWNVGADGAVHVLYSASRPSTIHYGDTAFELRATHLPHGTLAWAGEDVVTSNEGYGYSRVAFSVAQDGSLHVAYALTYEAYYYRSRDGVVWEAETYKDIISEAEMVDPANPGLGDDPAEVKGNIVLLAAQDFDHAAIVHAYNGGSFSVPSFYLMRRCPPFIGLKETWPAERLSLPNRGALAAVSETGMAAFLTWSGVRQDAPLP